MANHLELFMVLEQQAKPDAARQAEAFLRTAAIATEPVTLQQGALARQAFYDFGRGRIGSISVIASATHWLLYEMMSCSAPATTSHKPISRS